MPANPILSKLKWRVAAKLPGEQSWDKMKVVDKGMQPLNSSSQDEPDLPPQVLANPFLQHAYQRAFGQAGVPVPGTEMKTAAGKLEALKYLWRGLRGGGASTRSAASMGARHGAGLDSAWKKLFNETGRGGAFNSMTGQVGPAIGRAFGGSYIGHQFDSNEEGATPWGSIVGGLAGLGSPVAFSKMLGNAKAPKGSLRKLFADRTISRRIVNEPLNRTMLSGAMGNLVDMGGGALGYDTGGWGERIGIAGGLTGGMRPLAQALGGRFQTVNNALKGMKNIPGLGRGFQKAQRGGFTHLPSYLLGSPYVTGSGAAAMTGMVSHGVLDSTVGERVRGLAEKKQLLTHSLNAPEMQPARQMMEQTLKQVYGPEVHLFDPDGTPSREAITLMQRLGQHGMVQLQNADQNYFGNSGYMLNPNNWERLSSPMSALSDLIRGQATRINPLPF